MNTTNRQPGAAATQVSDSFQVNSSNHATELRVKASIENAIGYSGFRLWLLWLAANLIPFLLASAAAWLLGRIIGTTEREELTELTAAFLIAYGQSLILEKRIGFNRGWMSATLLGMLLGSGTLTFLVLKLARSGQFSSEQLPMLWAIGGATGGAVLGTAQFLWLRRKVRAAGWWIPASVIAWGLVGWADRWHIPMPHYVEKPAWAIALLVYATLTGVALL
jgi:hypothetical protein